MRAPRVPARRGLVRRGVLHLCDYGPLVCDEETLEAG